jgi:hypothetical protein
MRKLFAVLLVSGLLAATAGTAYANWVCGPNGCYSMSRIGR